MYIFLSDTIYEFSVFFLIRFFIELIYKLFIDKKCMPWFKFRGRIERDSIFISYNYITYTNM